MLKPYSIACLAAIGAKRLLMKQERAALVLPSNTACAAHCARLGLHQWFNVSGVPETDARPTNVAARQLNDKPGNFSNEVMQLLVSEMGLAVGVLPDLENHLDEVVLNAVTHSKSPIGCIVVGQGFPGKGCVEVAIVDLGQTIRGHLIGNPTFTHIQSDRQAIELATQEGVTGTVGRNRWNETNSGIGLFELRRHCEAGHGVLTVASGTACLTYQVDAPPQFLTLNTRFAGCLVNIQFFV